jgi:hypothetical protein
MDKTRSSSPITDSAMVRLPVPGIPALLRERPAFIPNGVEELLRLDGSFICVARTARHPTQVDGHDIAEGEQVLIYWASANRDESESSIPMSSTWIARGTAISPSGPGPTGARGRTWPA